MPTYRVSSINGLDIHFVQSGVAYTAPGDGGNLAISEILNPIPTGIVQVSQQPVLAPILASWTVTNSVNLFIPINIPGRYRVLLNCITGAYSVTFNGNGGQPLLLGAQMQWDRICQTRVVDTINIIATSAGTLLVNIESY
jgi:hypothetical protein